MSKIPYSSMSISELIKCFEKTCLEQYDTYITDNREVYNRTYKIQSDITDELKSRGPDARRRLLVLLKHGNPQVPSSRQMRLSGGARGGEEVPARPRSG